MKLNIVPASTGTAWVKLGFKTFFRQPLALLGLWFLWMVLAPVIGLIPLIGGPLALALWPAVSVGLLVAAEQALGGKFPMPTVLVSAFRHGRQGTRGIIILGIIYTVGVLVVIGVFSLIEGGEAAKLSAATDKSPQEVAALILTLPRFKAALLAGATLYTVLSVLFWHAPALVYWYGVSPVKSLFFSVMACYKNWRAMTIFTFVWAGIFFGAVIVFNIVAIAAGNMNLASLLAASAVPIMGAVLSTSIYFTFRDSFVVTPDDTPAGEDLADPTRTGDNP